MIDTQSSIPPSVVCSRCLSTIVCYCATVRSDVRSLGSDVIPSRAEFSVGPAKSGPTLAVPVNRRKGEKAGVRKLTATRIGIVPSWLPLDAFPLAMMEGEDATLLYGHLRGLAILSARKGRALAGAVGRREERTGDGVTVGEWSDPAPDVVGAHAIEDEETAHDAIATVWHRCSSRHETMIPVRLIRTVAKRMATRRAQHRVRMRDGLTQCTDHRMPKADAALTLAQLIAAVPTSRRAAFERAVTDHVEGRDVNRNAMRTIKGALKNVDVGDAETTIRV